MSCRIGRTGGENLVRISRLVPYSEKKVRFDLEHVGKRFDSAQGRIPRSARPELAHVRTRQLVASRLSATRDLAHSGRSAIWETLIEERIEPLAEDRPVRT